MDPIQEQEEAQLREERLAVLREDLDRAFVALPQKYAHYARVLRLRYLHGLTQAAVAERLGSTWNRVAGYKRRGKAWFAKNCTDLRGFLDR